MALHEAGMQCELREILLRDKPAAMLAISPKGTVPVLSFPDGRVIDESLDIMRWALPAFDAGLAFETAALIQRNDSEFKRHLDRYKYQCGGEADDVQSNFDAACVFLEHLD